METNDIPPETPFPIKQRYNYPKFDAITYPTGGRVYLTPNGDRVPSVTTILSKMVPKDGLDAWRKRKGETEANRITAEACRVGTTMHDRLEGFVSNYLQGRPDIPPETDEDKLAYTMATNIRKYGLPDLHEVWGIEEAVFCEGLYAGRTDLIGVYMRKSAIIDYKSSLRMKKPEWVESYKLQLAAYNVCHRQMFGEHMTTGVILIAIRPPCSTPLQRFILNESDMERYTDRWLGLLEKYHENYELPTG